MGASAGCGEQLPPSSFEKGKLSCSCSSRADYFFLPVAHQGMRFCSAPSPTGKAWDKLTTAEQTAAAVLGACLLLGTLLSCWAE